MPLRMDPPRVPLKWVFVDRPFNFVLLFGSLPCFSMVFTFLYDLNLGRVGEVRRVTKETNVFVKVNLDGNGVAENSTGIPFLDHMLDVSLSPSFYLSFVIVKFDSCSCSVVQIFIYYWFLRNVGIV